MCLLYHGFKCWQVFHHCIFQSCPLKKSIAKRLTRAQIVWYNLAPQTANKSIHLQFGNKSVNLESSPLHPRRFPHYHGKHKAQKAIAYNPNGQAQYTHHVYG